MSQIQIAVANSKFASPHLGGGVTSLLTLLDGLNDYRDISVDAFQTPPMDEIDIGFDYIARTNDSLQVPKLHWVNKELESRSWDRFFQNRIDTRYDLVIGQGLIGTSIINAASRFEIPSIFFVRSLISTGYYQYLPDYSHLSNLQRADIGGKIQYPFVIRAHNRYKFAVKKTDKVISNSEFTAEKLECLFSCTSSVIYPPISVETYQTQYCGNGYITIVNPRTMYKGADLFLDISKNMPGENFLLVGEAPDSIVETVKDIDNVKYEPWKKDMRNVYRRSKVVLVPSRVDESFGRVVAEAMVSGIPCVVSNRGALPSVVGEHGYVVEDLSSISEWEQKIELAVRDGYSPRRKSWAIKEYSADSQVEQFINIVEFVADSK